MWDDGCSLNLYCDENVKLDTQSCPTLYDPTDCKLQGSSVHWIFQAKVLEWVAISFSRGSSRARDRTQVARIAGRCFTIWAILYTLKLHTAFCQLYLNKTRMGEKITTATTRHSLSPHYRGFHFFLAVSILILTKVREKKKSFS